MLAPSLPLASAAQLGFGFWWSICSGAIEVSEFRRFSPEILPDSQNSAAFHGFLDLPKLPIFRWQSRKFPGLPQKSLSFWRMYGPMASVGRPTQRTLQHFRVICWSVFSAGLAPCDKRLGRCPQIIRRLYRQIFFGCGSVNRPDQ